MMKKPPSIADYKIAPFLFLRTPVFPWTQWGIPMDEKKRSYMDKAIAYASPDLHASLERKKTQGGTLKTAARNSLCHYENRLHFRPTPFGIFSSFTYLPWATHDQPIQISANPRFFAQDSMVVEAREKEALPMDSFRRLHLNPSLYRLGRNLRYFHYQIDTKKAKRIYCLKSIQSMPWIHAFLSQCEGKLFRWETAIQFLSESYAVPWKEAMKVLKDMLDCGLVLPWQRISITGPSPLHSFDDLSSLVASYPPSKEAKTNPYINAERTLLHGGVNNNYGSRIQNALGIIHRLKPTSPPSDLDRFTDLFQKKFEHNAVPLLEAIDPIRGLAYPLPLTQNPEHPTDRHVQALMIRKWMEAQKSASPIQIQEEDLTPWLAEKKRPAALPSSFAFLFRIHDHDLYLENAGGSHGTALLSRFTPFHRPLWKSCQEVADLESKANPHILFADLVHLEDFHLANIEKRYPLYPYEICFHDGAGMAKDNQLSVSDLMLSYLDGKLILWSRKHQKQVIPRLNAALNPQQSQIPVFRLLCDLSAGSIQTDLHLDMEEFIPHMDHYPRLYIGTVLLGLETWVIPRPDPKNPLTWEQIHEQMKSKAQNGLPNYVSLNQWDHQLVFDLSQSKDQQNLVHELRGNQKAFIKEWIPPKSSLVQDEDKQNYSHQFIGICYHPHPVLDHAFSLPSAHIPHWHRHWEEKKSASWTFFKIYLPENQIHHILAKEIDPWIQRARKVHPLASWFFVRYLDPEPHLRLRFRFRGTHAKGMIERFIQKLRQWEAEGEISRFEIRPYQPEVLRYPPRLIDECERLFCDSSEYLLALFRQGSFNGFRLDHPMPLWAPIDALCQGLGLSIEKREAYFHDYFQAMVSSENLDTSQFRKIKLRHSAAIEAWKQRDWSALPLPESLLPFIDQIKHSSHALSMRMTSLSEFRIKALLGDLVHMHLNRHLDLGQRRQEIMVYYLLWKKYSQMNFLQKHTIPHGKTV